MAKSSPRSRLNDVTQNDLVKYMVGREMKERFPKGNRQPGEVIFEVEDLEAVDPNNPSRKVLNGVSFNVRKGEILGIAGLMGSGRTELVMTIIRRIWQNHQRDRSAWMDKEIKPKSARAGDQCRLEPGAGRSQKDGAGVDPIDPSRTFPCPTWINFPNSSASMPMQEMQASLQQAKSLTIKAPSLDVQALKPCRAATSRKWSSQNGCYPSRSVLIMDDPTRGIDVGAKFEIYKLMNDLAEKGVAIIMISSELEEVLGMSDRVMVMCRGHSTITLPVAEASQERVMALATGVAVA